jgi:hypothetical protein
MFLFRSYNDRHGRSQMNTIPPSPAAQADADRIAADTAMLQRAADITLKVAEHIAQQILQEKPPKTETTAEPEKPAGPRSPDNRMVFDRLIRSLTAVMALKTRIATSRAPHPATRTAATSSEPQPDADIRRHFISAYLHDAIEGTAHPKSVRANLHNEAEFRIDDHLAADLEQKRSGGEIALEICDELNIAFDMSRMPDELLVPPGKTTPNGWDECLAQPQALVPPK